MSNRGALILAAALTAFVLVVAGGIAGRLARKEVRAASPAPAVETVVADRTREPRAPVRPAAKRWRDDDDDRQPRRARRFSQREREDDDD